MKNIKYILFCLFFWISPIKAVLDVAAFSTYAAAAGVGGKVVPEILLWVWNNPNESVRRIKILGQSVSCCCCCFHHHGDDADWYSSAFSQRYPRTMSWANVQTVNYLLNTLQEACPDQFCTNLGDGYSFVTKDYTFELRFGRAEDPMFGPDKSSGADDFLRKVKAAVYPTGLLSDDYFKCIDASYNEKVDHYRLINYLLENPSCLWVRFHTGLNQSPIIFKIMSTRPVIVSESLMHPVAAGTHEPIDPHSHEGVLEQPLGITTHTPPSGGTPPAGPEPHEMH